MNIKSWIALVIACIALGLSIVMFTNVSGRVDDLEETVEEHGVWIEEVKEGLESIGEALIEGLEETLESLSELSCEIPLSEEWPELPPIEWPELPPIPLPPLEE